MAEIRGVTIAWRDDHFLLTGDDLEITGCVFDGTGNIEQVDGALRIYPGSVATTEQQEAESGS